MDDDGHTERDETIKMMIIIQVGTKTKKTSGRRRQDECPVRPAISYVILCRTADVRRRRNGIVSRSAFPKIPVEEATGRVTLKQCQLQFDTYVIKSSSSSHASLRYTAVAIFTIVIIYHYNATVVL